MGGEAHLRSLWKELLASWQVIGEEGGDAEAFLAAGGEGVVLLDESLVDAYFGAAHRQAPCLLFLPEVGAGRVDWPARGVIPVPAPLTHSKVHDALIEAFKPAASALSATAAASRQDEAQSGDKTPFLGRHILLAEDNVVNQRVAVALLSKLGCAVTLAGNGREAVELFERETFDLVLMDCQMPELDGFAATAEIRRREKDARHTPIVAMTANALEGDREKCLAAGMDDYLSKPVAQARLMAVLARWLGTVSGDQQGQAAASESVVDREQLAAATGGDEELMREILDIFAAGLPALVARIADAAESEDCPRLAAAAHELKGSAANVGAKRLARIAAEIESAAKKGEKPRSWLVDLSAAQDEFLQWVRSSA